MTKLEKVATSHNFKFMGVGVFVPLQEQFAENAYKILIEKLSCL